MESTAKGESLNALQLLVVHRHLVQADNNERNDQITENERHHWCEPDHSAPARLVLNQSFVLLLAFFLCIHVLGLQIIKRFSNWQRAFRQFQLFHHAHEWLKRRILLELRQRLFSALIKMEQACL